MYIYIYICVCMCVYLYTYSMLAANKVKIDTHIQYSYKAFK